MAFSGTTTSSTDGPSIPTGRFKPLVSFLKYKKLALVIIIVVSALGIPVSSKKTAPTYTAIVAVLVSPKFIPNLSSERGMDLGRTEYGMYIKQQIKMITRRDVLQEALQMPKVRENWLLTGESDLEGRIRLKQALSVKSKRGDPFITITLTFDEPKKLDIVLNGVVEVYLKRSQEETIFDSSGRIDRLQTRQKELEELISIKQKQRTQIALELGVTTFQENSLNPYDDILIESMKVHTLAHRQRVEAETRLAALKATQRNGKTVLDIFVNEMVANDSVLKSYKSKLIERRTELLTQTLGLTSKHPSRRRAVQEIAKIDQDIEQATNEFSEEIRHSLLAKGQAEIYQAQRLEQALASELKRQRTHANHYAALYNEALAINQDIVRAYRLLDRINDRIDFLAIESTAPGFVRLDSPSTKVLESGGNRKIIVLMFIVVAVGLGIGVPILLDMLDQRIRTPGEVHKILGFPPMAWILNRHDMSTSQLATDYLRRMALALERDWHTHETTGFVLTSVKPGGGTTTLTLELACVLGELGVRTLVLELNAFKPDDRYLGPTPYNSLITLLNQTPPLRSPEALVIPATADLPDRLPVGETTKRHLVTHGKLRTILKELNAHYDLILMDAPPLLLSSDAELLGEIAGGVLLVIEAQVVSPGELKRAAQLLERLNPPVVGAILNRVKVFRGGGYFAELLTEYETGAKLRPGLIKRLFWP